MKKNKHTDNYRGIRDGLLYCLAPILAKYYSHLVNSEEAYEIARYIVDILDSKVASAQKKKGQ